MIKVTDTIRSQKMKNEIKYLKAYAIYVLVGFLAGAIIGFIQGVILGAILGALGYPIEKIPLITGITGFFFGIFVSFFIFRWSIQKFILTQLDEAKKIDVNQSTQTTR